jgi:sulfur carrier protein
VAQLRLTINGESVELPGDMRVVSDVLRHFGLADKVVMVELNEQALPREKHHTTAVAEGDRLEIAHFVGGG